MTFLERASIMTHEEIASLLQEQERTRRCNEELTARVADLQQQLDWLSRHVFGTKSERRLLPDSAAQLSLGDQGDTAAFVATVPEPPIAVPEHTRRKRTRHDDCVTDQGLRFDASVPVEVIEIANPAIEGLSAHEYDVVAERSTYRLAQRPGSYVVLRYVRTVIRRKDTREISCPPAPPAVLDRSFADVSLLAGLLVDKFAYHIPLHRQHQRLRDTGIEVDRSTLTHLVHRTADLLTPIVQAQMRSILQSKVLAMDETPVRAGRKHKGKMRQSYFWPVYGDRDEVVFHFASTRSAATVPKVLGNYAGVLLSDGYEAYERYAGKLAEVVHAQCWAHARRKFVEAEATEPDLCADVLRRIRALYEHEGTIRTQDLDGDDKVRYRAEYCRPVVDGVFERLRTALDERALLPTSPFTKAAGYTLRREASLRVFLENPDVPIDTNHLERQIRPIALGRKNWVFCWTEAGAEVVATAQSLIATCRLHDVDAYTYLVDVLQRISTHPATDVEQLTPRLWKEHFAGDPLRSSADGRSTANADALSRVS